MRFEVLRSSDEIPTFRRPAGLAGSCGLSPLDVRAYCSRSVPAPPRTPRSLERAALSASNNIAEGFERGTSNELLAFLYIARGSAGEVRLMMRVLETWNIFSHCRSQISNFIVRCEKIAKQLYGWIESLKIQKYPANADWMKKQRIATRVKRSGTSS